MSLSSDNTVMTMPVAPAYGGGYGSNGMWGDNFLSWIIILLLFGGRGFGFGGLGGFGGFGGLGGMLGGFGGWGSPYAQGVLTRADINDGFALQNLQNSQTSIKDAVTNGFHGVDNAVCQLGYNTQQGFNNLASQLASCCCETQRQIERGFCDTNYNLATNTTAIIQNAHNDTDRVIAKLNDMESARQAEKIAALQAENQSLRFQASQTAQNAFITANQEAQTAELLRRLGRDCPVAAYVVPNPNCCYGTPVGVLNNGGCGCNNGCGCVA